MACSESVPTVITLKDGFVVPVAALRLAWSLEDRGFTLQPDGHQLRVRPAERLTADDVLAIQRCKADLLALTVHVEEMGDALTSGMEA